MNSQPAKAEFGKAAHRYQYLCIMECAPIFSEDYKYSDDGFRQNTLLASLADREGVLLRPHLRKVQLEQGGILTEIGSTIDRVYFPVSGILNVFVLTLDGHAVRIETVGSEGVIGINFESGCAKARVVAQLSSVLLSIKVAEFRDIIESNPLLRRMYEQTLESQLEQARSAAVCNLLHSAEQRFCRLLLDTSDRTSSDQVRLTHEILSELVGVQRSFVTGIASSLRRQNAIEYERGTITIVNRRVLKQLACDCTYRAKNWLRTPT